MRTPLRSLSFLTLAAATFSSCPELLAQNAAWTTFKGDTARTGASSAQVRLPLSLQWRFSSDAPARTYSTSPLVIGAAGRQRAVFATGRHVFALDMATGQQIWRSPELSANIVTPLTLLSGTSGDFILGAQSNGTVIALKSTDGGRAWSTDVKANISESAPLVVDILGNPRIIVALNTGRLVALDAAGKLDPTFNVALDQFGQLPAGTLALSGDASRIFAQLSDGRLFCVDAATGRVLWRFQLAARPSVTPIAAQDVVIATTPGQIAAIRFSGGTPAWRFRPKGDVVASPALQTKGTQSTLFYGTRTGFFQALDAQTGELKWEKNLGFSFTGSPLVLETMIVVGTSKGLMVALSPQNGDVLWQYRLKTEREVTVRAPKTRDQNNTTGQNDGATQPTTPTEAGTGELVTRVFPVSSSPAAVNSNILVLGDNAALYSFTSQLFDADPPRVLFPSLTVPDSRKDLISLDVAPTSQQIVPGTGPIYFALELDDIGSGVDDKTVAVTLDGEALDASRVVFDAESGTLTLTINDPKKNDVSLSDGVKTLIVSARDYAGNELKYTGSFLVDNTAPAPEPPQEETPVDGQPGGPQPGN